MSEFTTLLTMVVLLVLVLRRERIRRRALRVYWDRPCMGIRWRRRFPNTSKSQIREFLTIFVDAFCFDHRRRTCFSPDDRVMQIYRTDNPPGSLTDNLELETLGLSLEERYGIDFTAAWREDLTLGQLFEDIKKRAG
jgi:hypothetical protein